MKRVLLMDAPNQFRDLLKEKLASAGIELAITNGRRDSFTKTITLLPDLIIIDFQGPFSDLIDFLEKKRSNPNTTNIPVFVTGKPLSPELLSKLIPLQVIKYFNRPIKFDILFESLSKVLRTALSVDTTPSIVDTHLNENIIFIEIARGLNRDKISMISYKICETIDANKLTNPKIVLMLTNIKFAFYDAVNLELLLNNVISDSRVRHKNIKILSFDSFVRDFVEGRKEYSQLEVVEDLTSVMSSLVTSNVMSDDETNIVDKILTATDDAGEDLVGLKFSEEFDHNTNIIAKRKNLKIAIVDGDAAVRGLLEKAFKGIYAEVDLFSTATEFLTATTQNTYSLVILEIMLNDIPGFNVLMNLRSKQYSSPVIVYSQVSKKEIVVQALSLGAKAYLVKPLGAEEIIAKSIEVINVTI